MTGEQAAIVGRVAEPEHLASAAEQGVDLAAVVATDAALHFSDRDAEYRLTADGVARAARPGPRQAVQDGLFVVGQRTVALYNVGFADQG